MKGAVGEVAGADVEGEDGGHFVEHHTNQTKITQYKKKKVFVKLLFEGLVIWLFLVVYSNAPFNIPWPNQFFAMSTISFSYVHSRSSPRRRPTRMVCRDECTTNTYSTRIPSIPTTDTSPVEHSPSIGFTHHPHPVTLCRRQSRQKRHHA